MTGDEAEAIALRLDDGVLTEIADMFRRLPADEVPQCRIEFEAMSVDLSEPLGRNPQAHVALQMLKAMEAGFDPQGVADAFSDWRVLPNRAEVQINEWMAELPPLKATFDDLKGGDADV